MATRKKLLVELGLDLQITAYEFASWLEENSKLVYPEDEVKAYLELKKKSGENIVEQAFRSSSGYNYNTYAGFVPTDVLVLMSEVKKAFPVVEFRCLTLGKDPFLRATVRGETYILACWDEPEYTGTDEL